MKLLEAGAGSNLLRRPRAHAPSVGAAQCRRKFLRYFPAGFADAKYAAWERDYKWRAHEEWTEELGPEVFPALVAEKKFSEVARRALRIESRTNLLFSFEKMAIRDALKEPSGARAFALGMHALLHQPGSIGDRFQEWCGVIAGLPRRQTRVLTWPVATVFGFLAQPSRHIYLKPVVTRAAAKAYGCDFRYQSRPTGETYEDLLAFARTIRRDLDNLGPRDMIDVQSFIWVQGSAEYPD